MTEPCEPPPHRPLLSTGGLWALIGGTLLVLLVLLPLAQGRLHKAALLAPSSLSIRYLELSLDQRPQSRSLRMELVKKLIQSGQLDKARRNLVQLTAADDAQGLFARLMLVDLDLRAWAGIVSEQRAARAVALERVLADMRAIDVASLSISQLERFARLYRELEQPLAAAELFDVLAEHGRSRTASRLTAADAAWLAAGLPARAAELHAQAASRPGQPTALGIAEARLALERTRSFGDPEASTRMIGRMRALYPADTGLLELAIQLAEEHDVQRAFALAGLLVAAAPHQPKYHRLMARLAEATGRGLRALDEDVWLVRHGGDESDRARALALAKANWDLALYRELLQGRSASQEVPRTIAACKRGKPRCRTRTRAKLRAAPVRSRHRCQAGPAVKLRAARLRELRERQALDEALGDPSAALRKLTAAVETDLSDVLLLWQDKFDLELRQADSAAAVMTAKRMLQRFPGRASSERLAGLQLAMGETHAALDTLLAATLEPSEQDESWQRRTALLAFEVGDLAAERDAYGKLVALPQASFWDYQRLWELAPDRRFALRVALAAFERFESPQMLAAAVELYAAQGREAEQLALLERAEHIAAVTERPQYWLALISWHQRCAARAAKHAQYPRAKQQLAAAERLLERAVERTPHEPRAYQQLSLGQHAQTLSLGLATDDMRLTASAYAAYHDRLSTAERVYVLRRLGKSEQALSVVRNGLQQDDLAERDRSALEAEASQLGQSIRRYARVNGDILQMDGLLVRRSAATVEYTGASELRAEASFVEYRPRETAAPVLADAVRDVSGALQGRVGVAALEVGVRVRVNQSLQPFATFAVQFAGKPEAGGGVRLHVNELATDTSRLRALGMRDALVLDTAIPFGKHLYVSARGAAEAFYTRQERRYLGAGLTLDAGLGASFALPAQLGTAGIRLASRLAPRFAKRPTASEVDGRDQTWLPRTTEWVGMGASLGRGQLEIPPLLGRQFCYLLDAAAGWSLPASKLGFTAQIGVGASILGADLLTLTARGGNVVGSTTWSANLGYGLTLDR